MIRDRSRVSGVETAAMNIDLRWVNQVMAFLCAANFVVSALHTVLLLSE